MFRPAAVKLLSLIGDKDICRSRSVRIVVANQYDSKLALNQFFVAETNSLFFANLLRIQRFV